MSFAVQEDLVNAVEEYLAPFAEQFHECKIVRNGEGFDVRAQVKEQDKTKALILKVLILDSHRRVGIPNIFMPAFMRQQGIGKRLISVVFETGKKHGYETFVIDLTPSFFERLKNRDALVIEDGEVVQITDSTRLA